MKWIDLLWRLVQVAVGPFVQELKQDLARWRWWLFQSLLLTLLASMCGLVVLLLVALLVVMAYWDTHRLEALSGLVLAYTALAAWMVWRARHLMILPSGASSSGRDEREPCCGVRSGRACRGN